MDAGLLPARPTRVRYRHELRSLAYVTLDQANGGVVRNLTDRGIGVQLIVPVHPNQQLQIRFEVREPRFRVEARGKVVWATLSGQCGIRFLDLPPRMVRQINEWIFGNLLAGISLHADGAESMFATPTRSVFAGNSVEGIGLDDENDGLIVSATPVKVIELPVARAVAAPVLALDREIAAPDRSELDWLSQPLSGRGLARTIDALTVLAGTLLVAVVFLSVTREAPRWPWALGGADALFVGILYWGFFRMFGGASLGTRLARLAESNGEDEDPSGVRFR